MRISVVHSFYGDGVPSGENTVVQDQIQNLAERHDVQLVARKTPDAQGLAYRLRSAANAGGFRSDRTVLEEVDSFRPDVVHVHNTFPNIGQSWLSQARHPFIVTMHNYRTVCANGVLWRDGDLCHECLEYNSLRGLRHGCYRGSKLATLPLSISTAKPSANPLIARSKRILCLNEDSRSLFARLAGASKVELVPNFATVSEQFRNEDELRKRDGFIFAGRLAAEKGVSWLSAAWPDDVGVLKFVGAGAMSDELSASARANVRFIGKLRRDDLLAQIAQAKAVIIPSLWSEGIPTIALEALGCGTPVLISSRCTSAAKVAVDQSLIFNPDEGAEGLRNSLRALDDRFAHLVRRAKQLYDTSFSPAVWQKSYDTIVQAVHEEVLRSATH